MCITPIQLKKETVMSKLKDTYRMQQVPCGKCIDCRKARVNSWYVRLLEEKKISTSAHFVTLTYDDITLPYSDSFIPTLDYADFQRFVKRLRKNYNTQKSIKYFAVGEYGSKTDRPHYHVIMFNVENPDRIVKEWEKYGFAHIGEVTDASIYYTLKYTLKNIGSDKPKNELRKPEKALISKKLGLSYLTPQMIQYYKDDNSRSVTMLGNKKTALPRYYRDKIFTESEKMQRVKKMQKIIQQKYETTLNPLYVQIQQKRIGDQAKKNQKTD